MKMDITEKKENAVLKRTEVRFTIAHKGEATPKLTAVSEEIVKNMKSKKGAVVIEKIETRYGGGISEGYAKVYESEEAALEYESEHFLKRNGISKPEYKPAEEQPAE